MEINTCYTGDQRSETGAVQHVLLPAGAPDTYYVEQENGCLIGRNGHIIARDNPPASIQCRLLINLRGRRLDYIVFTTCM